MLCKKLTFKEEGSNLPTIILGIVVSEDSRFVVFKTAKHEYTINKICIISMRETNIEFKEAL
jgi:hypothetical protein